MWRKLIARECLACLLTLMGAAAAAGADYYAGRTIDFVIGGDVAGGYDIYARLVGRHLPRFMPGHPTIVPKNQPGAGSARAASYLYSLAPKDGSVIGALFPGAIMGPLLDEHAQTLFDPSKFAYLGSGINATRVCITHASSKIKRFEDALARKTIMGASAAGASTRDYVTMHRKATGALFELVAGYKGSADILLAMERGEVDGMCGFDWSSLKSQRPDWVAKREVNILIQTNLEPDPELTHLGVPQTWSYLKSESDRAPIELIISQQVFGRPYVAPPGIAAEPLAILRAAFSATMRDAEFLADAARARVDVAPSSGEKVQQLIEKLYAAPASVLDRARDLLKP
jgi:tripartite-type tricarboxylate transporter receptor subunit TctC